MERRVLKRIAWFICASSLLSLSQALWLTIPASQSKCVSEEIHSNVVVLADYYVVAEDYHNVDTNISVKVTSPYGSNLYNAQNVTTGQFAFTTHEAGNYLACFWADSKNQNDLSINLDWKTGIAAKDWASVAKKEKIEGVELELKKLEESVQAIHENLLYLKERERAMRSVSETTNTRVALFSLLSLAICLAVSISQILYLKRYFQKKKLI